LITVFDQLHKIRELYSQATYDNGKDFVRKIKYIMKERLMMSIIQRPIAAWLDFKNKPEWEYNGKYKIL
jgi:hypothetical protein